METVAHHLQIEAIGRRNNLDERDWFGRSAYNRYYYATFLCVREGLGNLDKSWAAMPHALYPDILNGTIKKSILHGRRQASRLEDQSLVLLYNQAASAAVNLATLMQLGFSVRVIADYRPEIKVEFTETRFALNNVDITDAHQWPARAKAFVNTIEKAWMQINV